MIEINVPKNINGVVYTVKSVESITIACPRTCSCVKDRDFDCWQGDELNEKGIPFNKGKFECVKVVINIKNLSKKEHRIDEDNIKLIDSDGFSYEGKCLCEKCLPLRAVRNLADVQPQTQVNFIQVFPTLEDGCDIALLKIYVEGNWVDFSLSDTYYNPFEDVVQVAQKISSAEDISQGVITENENSFSNVDYRIEWSVQVFVDRLNKIKTSIYSRLNNVLTESERTKIHNKISNELYNLELDLGARSESDFDGIKEEVQAVRKKYLDELSLLNERDSDRLVLSKRVEDLLELSPREFEHYVGELFFNLGFEVEVTPYSNDQGIDIIMFKGHEKYGVQCKRYKGSVGSPDIQNFIGALDHLKADKGIFVTTGSFTFEAEKMASQHPIQLINRVDLANLIMESLKSASSNGLSFQENVENDNQMRFDF